MLKNIILKYQDACFEPIGNNSNQYELDLIQIKVKISRKKVQKNTRKANSMFNTNTNSVAEPPKKVHSEALPKGRQVSKTMISSTAGVIDEYSLKSSHINKKNPFVKLGSLNLVSKLID